MSVIPYLKKLKYIYTEEGPVVLFKRLYRYFFYVLRRRLQNNTDDKNKWKKIKGAYKGKRTFILGNGPSLNKTPLYLLNNEYTFCFNRFDLMLERLAWNPSFFAVIDDLVLDDTYQIINSMTDQVDYAFFPDIHPSAPVNKNFKSIIEEKENVYWLHLSNIGFTDQLPNCGINKTVANVAVQILTYMGFSEIYFIGVDLDYKIPETVISENRRELTGSEDDDPNHFDPRYFGKGKKYHYPRMDETFEKFDEASTFLVEKNVKAYNAGIGGKLEAFERVDFESLFDYTSKEKLELMLNHIVDIGKIKSSNLDDIFPDALKLKSIEEWDDSYDEVICSLDIGYRIIPKKVIEYLPLGPFNGKYLFLKKKKYDPHNSNVSSFKNQ